VLRETRWTKIGMIAPVFVTFVIGSSIVVRALRTGAAADVVLAVEGWLFIAVLWICTLWIARGTWRPLADTTAAFIDISIRRREANLRIATLAAYFYAAQLLFVVLVMMFDTRAGAIAVLTSLPALLLAWVGVPSMFVWLLWYRRRQRAALLHLRELERELRGD
jgi:hypothetical protein